MRLFPNPKGNANTFAQANITHLRVISIVLRSISLLHLQDANLID